MIMSPTEVISKRFRPVSGLEINSAARSENVEFGFSILNMSVTFYTGGKHFSVIRSEHNALEALVYCIKLMVILMVAFLSVILTVNYLMIFHC